ncbi:hypothetical protein D3C71_788060 [compost metagenome]
MVTFSQLDNGRKVASAYDTMRSSKEPEEPRLQRNVEHDHVDDHFYDAKDVIGTGDHPVIISAMWNAIIKSDHPTLQAEVKKLYTIAKLCIGSDDEDLEEAIDSVRETERVNKQVDEANKEALAQYKRQLKMHDDQIESTRVEFRRWWDFFVDDLKHLLEDSNNNVEGVGKVWPLIIKDCLDQQRDGFYEKLSPKWHSKKIIDMTSWKSDKWPNFNQMHEFGTKLMESIELKHRAFITKETNDLIDVITKTAEYKDELKRIRRVYDHYGFYWEKVKKSGSKYFTSPEGDTYVYDYRPDEPLDRDEYWPSRYDSYGYRDSYRNRQDEMYEAMERLNKRALETAENIIRQRQRDYVDGYDRIYLENEKTKPLHTWQESW